MTKAEQPDPVLGKTFAEVLGEIVWLMTQSKETQQMPISEIERLVMPGILLKQFHIQYSELPAAHAARKLEANDTKPKRNLQPVAAEIFAMVSEQVAKKVTDNSTYNLTLQDWKSGDNKLVMLNVALHAPSDPNK